MGLYLKHTVDPVSEYYTSNNHPSEIQEVSSYHEDYLNQQLKLPLSPDQQHNMS